MIFVIIGIICMILSPFIAWWSILRPLLMTVGFLLFVVGMFSLIGG